MQSAKRELNSLARHLLFATLPFLLLGVQLSSTQLFSIQVAAQEPTPADPASRDVVWRFADADCTYRVNAHRRVRVQGADQEIETVRISAGNGTHVRIVTEVEPVRIVDETEIVVPVKSDRRRLQVLARVVLPRSRDPHTGGPVTILVSGGLYQDLNNWQRLALTNIPRKRDEAARALRLQLDTKIDVRESYIDLLCVNVYGGRGTTTTQLAIPEIDGQPQQTRRPDTISVAKAHAPRALNLRSTSHPIQRVSHDAPLLTADGTSAKSDGNMFFVNGQPSFVRMIDHQGEDFAYLKQLGFNAVRLSTLATDSQLESATRNNIWIVCPPPQLDEVQLGSNYRGVIAWDMGERLVAADLERTVGRINEIRSNEYLPPLPILGSVDSNLHAFSSHLDVVVHHREPIGTGLPLNRYVTWLENRPHLCSPATLHWAAVQTESIAALAYQWQAFQYPGNGATPIELSQLQHIAFSAVGAGMRGLHFRSRTPLNSGTPAAQTRSAMLQLVNLELDRIEPWTTAGKNSGSASSDLAGASSFVLQTKRGQLLCVLQSDQNAQYVPSVPAAKASVTVPGVPAMSEVYQLTDAGVKPLATRRVAGGSRIEFEQLTTPTLVAVTQDPIVVQSLARNVNQRLPQIASLRQRLAKEVYDRTVTIAQELGTHGVRIPKVAQDLERAEALLRKAAELAGEKQYAVVGDLARKATSSITAAQRELWERSNRAIPAANASPLCTQIGTLPWHWHLVRHLPVTKGTFNLLQTGDFEQEQLAGWKSLQHTPQDVSVQVSLTSGLDSDAQMSSGSQPYSGARCLRLAATANSAAASQSVMESPLVWVHSPPITVRANQLVKIAGMVKVSEPIAGSPDGVLIFDSLGGPDLGYRILTTDDWQPFVFYRAAAQKRPVSLTVALTGLGEVLIDKVAISPVVDLKASTAPPVETIGASVESVERVGQRNVAPSR